MRKNNNNKALLFSLVYARNLSSKMKEIRTKASQVAHVSCGANDPFELKWLLIRENTARLASVNPIYKFPNL